MAVFRPQQNNNVCKLNFDDKFFYTVDLHENSLNEIAEIAKKQVKFLEGIKEFDKDAFDKAYNSSLDAIDEILGEGAAADIMSLYEKPSIFNVVSVINFIVEEYKAAYSALFDKHKANGTVPPTVQRGRR